MSSFGSLIVLTCVTLVVVSGNPCPSTESLDITGGELQSNGSMLYEGNEYNSSEWYQVNDEGVTSAYGCPCLRRVCLWKCCPSGQAFHNRTCSETDLSDVNPFNPAVFAGQTPAATQANGHFFYMYNRLCEDRYLVDSDTRGEELYIQENGTLLEVASGGAQWHASTQYCADVLRDAGPARPVAAVCYPDEVATDDSKALYTTYGFGMLLLSTPFLLATWLVYALVPELRNLHGMCLMAYCGGLIVAYVFLAYLKLNVWTVGVTMDGCVAIAFIVYYSMQTSFFWLNVMCFDIWRTFSGYRGGGADKRRELRRFALYGLYAWGAPALLTAATALAQLGVGGDGLVRPGFGVKRCWFDSWLSELVYFFSPVLALVVCNVVLFLITANRIRSIRQETAILKGSESARSDKMRLDKQRYALYVKLFVVMGVNWTVELVSFAVGGSNWFWIVVDLSNIALGFFIFVIFVWKNKVRNLLVKRFRSFRGAAAESGPRWGASSAPTEDTRLSADDSTAATASASATVTTTASATAATAAGRLKEIH